MIIYIAMSASIFHLFIQSILFIKVIEFTQDKLSFFKEILISLIYLISGYFLIIRIYVAWMYLFVVMLFVYGGIIKYNIFVAMIHKMIEPVQ